MPTVPIREHAPFYAILSRRQATLSCGTLHIMLCGREDRAAHMQLCNYVCAVPCVALPYTAGRVRNVFCLLKSYIVFNRVLQNERILNSIE